MIAAGGPALAVASGVGLVGLWGFCQATSTPELLGPMGASLALLAVAPEGDLCQPRNLIGGHVLSAAVAWALVAALGAGPLTVPLGFASVLLVMLVTKTMHPPGCATALVILLGYGQGPGFLAGAAGASAILVAVGWGLHRLVTRRPYPLQWF